MADDSSIPINIHSAKLTEWLTSRRHCAGRWQDDVLKVREKINAAIQDMPEHPKIVQLLSGTYINYFHCLQIIQILKETEAETKNIFGRYSSQRMKDWQQIVSMYEDDCCYLADASQSLQRMIAYDIPALKKQIAKCAQGQDECTKKETDYLKLAKDSDRQFKTECENMRIKGVTIKRELVGVAKGVPEFLDSAVEQLLRLQPALELYRHFRKLNSRSEPDVILPITEFVLANGNTTYFEWKTGTRPEIVQLPEVECDDADQNQAEDVIDFGDFEQVDFGEDGQIDFAGISLEDAAGITTVIDGAGDDFIPPQDDGIARGLEALTVLEHPETQAKLLIEFQELETFLTCRLNAVRHPHPAEYLISQYIDTSRLVDLGESEISTMLSHTTRLRQSFIDPNLKHLFKIRSNAKYLDTLTSQLENKKQLSEKYKTLATLSREKYGELGAEAVKIQPELDGLIRRTKELQKQIEEDISAKYKGRPVHILGAAAATSNK